ncbi:MAG TPA: DUF192 domain-containing protein [Polyangiales bacterium]|nr:DUF192 domain-containing protein [Polyangiales bacterium]
MRTARVFALTFCLACSTGNAPTSAAPGPAAEPAAAAPQPKKKLGDPQPKLPVGKVVLETPPRAPMTVDAEVAATDSQRQMGLMFRESMRDDEGMLFLFPTERHNAFWMHNTLIPLDMLFIDADWKVVGIVENARPLTDDSRSVPKMSQYVLELNAGAAARNGLGEGTEVRFTPPSGIQLP